MSIITKQKFDAVVPAFRDATDSVYRKMVPQLELYESRTAEFAPYEKLNELRERYICLAAALNAVRSLDLVLTGSGFGVISTAEKTPRLSSPRGRTAEATLPRSLRSVRRVENNGFDHRLEQDPHRTEDGGQFPFHPHHAARIRSHMRGTRRLCARIQPFGTGTTRGEYSRSPRDFPRALRGHAGLVERWWRISHRRRFTPTAGTPSHLAARTHSHGKGHGWWGDSQSRRQYKSVLSPLWRTPP